MTLVLALAAALCLSGDPDTAKVTVEFDKTPLSDVLSNLTLLTEVHHEPAPVGLAERGGGSAGAGP